MSISWSILVGGAVVCVTFYAALTFIIHQRKQWHFSPTTHVMLHKIRSTGITALVCLVGIAMLWTGWRLDSKFVPENKALPTNNTLTYTPRNDSDRDAIIREEGQNLQNDSQDSLNNFREEFFNDK